MSKTSVPATVSGQPFMRTFACRRNGDKADAGSGEIERIGAVILDIGKAISYKMEQAGVTNVRDKVVSQPDE